MALLVAGGLVQELCLLGGHPRLGLAGVGPIIVAVFWLWSPSREALIAIAIALGIELMLPLHTGAGRFFDWAQHWEAALRYAGQPNSVVDEHLAGRTPLFNQLAAGVSASLPSYAVFQIVSVLLNSLWLWPATLWIRDHAPDDQPGRLLSIAVVPVVLAYDIYTWPWGFTAFFLLGALWLCSRGGRNNGTVLGLALAGALLAHPGALGYVGGLGLLIVFQRRDQLLGALAAGGAVALTAVPWVLDVTGGRGPLALITSSAPAHSLVPIDSWAHSRLLLVVHAFVPHLRISVAQPWADGILALAIQSLVGVLLITVLVARRSLGLKGPLVWAIIGGALVGWVIYPFTDSGVFMDPLYLGILAYLLVVHTRVKRPIARTLLALEAGWGSLFVAALVWVAWAAGRYDSNLALKHVYGAQYVADLIGPLPGAALVVAAVFLAARITHTER
jgi:hypothetical protein